MKKVEYGTITKCTICGEELSRNIHTRKVSFFEEKDWKVVTKEIVCNRCNTEIIDMDVSYFCNRCGKLYDTKSYHGTRKFAPEQDHREGFCSNTCKAYAKGEKIVNDQYDKVKNKLKEAVE